MREDIKLWIKQFALESTGIHIDETISLLDPRNGLMPRDLIVLFFELQKHYKIKFVEQGRSCQKSGKIKPDKFRGAWE